MRDIFTLSPKLPFDQRSPFNFHLNKDGSDGNHLIIGETVRDKESSANIYESPANIYTEDNKLPADGVYTAYFMKGEIVHDETVLFEQDGVEYVHPSGEGINYVKNYMGLGVIPKPQS